MTQDVPTLWSEHGIISDVVVRPQLRVFTFLFLLKSQFLALY